MVTGFTGRAEVTEVQPAHASRRGGAGALSTEPAGGFNHTERLETQHFLSAVECRLSCHYEESEVSAVKAQEAQDPLGQVTLLRAGGVGWTSSTTRGGGGRGNGPRDNQPPHCSQGLPRAPTFRGQVSGEGTTHRNATHRNARRHFLCFGARCQ